MYLQIPAVYTGKKDANWDQKGLSKRRFQNIPEMYNFWARG